MVDRQPRTRIKPVEPAFRLAGCERSSEGVLRHPRDVEARLSRLTCKLAWKVDIHSGHAHIIHTDMESTQFSRQGLARSSPTRAEQPPRVLQPEAATRTLAEAPGGIHTEWEPGSMRTAARAGEQHLGEASQSATRPPDRECS